MYAIDATDLLKKVQTLQSLDGWEVIHKHDVMIAPVLDVVPTAELTAAHARIAELEAKLEAKEMDYSALRESYINSEMNLERLQSNDKEAMKLLEAAVAQLYGDCQRCGSDAIH